MIKKNPKLSRKELTELIKYITEDGIKYILDKLKDEEKIKREGGAKGKIISTFTRVTLKRNRRFIY
ncbi:MAG: hypothetical protein ACLFN8_04235 [Candidatus Woesearchaeota archaeon]